MILNRIAEALRQQNWTTVLIELVVVVIGIFFGLQVDDWNKARKDRLEEIVYLERIADDIRQSIADNTDTRDFQAEHSKLGIMALRSLKACELHPSNRDDFASAVYLLAKTAPSALARVTLDELMSTGRMTVISSQKLRQRLVQILEFHNAELAFIDSVEQRLVPHLFYVAHHAPIVVTGPIGGGSRVTWEALGTDFSELCKDPKFYNSFASALNFSWDVTASQSRWSSTLEELLSELEAELAGRRN